MDFWELMLLLIVTYLMAPNAWDLENKIRCSVFVRIVSSKSKTKFAVQTMFLQWQSAECNNQHYKNMHLLHD